MELPMEVQIGMSYNYLKAISWIGKLIKLGSSAWSSGKFAPLHISTTFVFSKTIVYYQYVVLNKYIKIKCVNDARCHIGKDIDNNGLLAWVT